MFLKTAASLWPAPRVSCSAITGCIRRIWDCNSFVQGWSAASLDFEPGTFNGLRAEREALDESFSSRITKDTVLMTPGGFSDIKGPAYGRRCFGQGPRPQ